MANIKFSFDDSTFIKNVEEVTRRLHQDMVDTIKDMSKTFTNVAAEYTPPWPKGSMREKKILPRFITRKIVDLAAKTVIGTGEHYELDRVDKIMLYAKKMPYKVIYDREGLRRLKKKGGSIYVKTLPQAEAAARVHNRGLARAMWGKHLGDIGVFFGNAIGDAIRAMGSSGTDYNSVIFREDDNTVSVTIDNGATSVDTGMLQRAADKAWARTKSYFDYKLKGLIKRDKDL